MPPVGVIRLDGSQPDILLYCNRRFVRPSLHLSTQCHVGTRVRLPHQATDRLLLMLKCYPNAHYDIYLSGPFVLPCLIRLHPYVIVIVAVLFLFLFQCPASSPTFPSFPPASVSPRLPCARLLTCLADAVEEQYLSSHRIVSHLISPDCAIFKSACLSK